MQTINLRHCKHLYWRQIIVLFLLLCSGRMIAFAQLDLNLTEHDDKPYYFGITLSGNSASFQLQHHPSFLTKDSVTIVSPVSKGGFGLGLLGSIRINRHLEARFNPHLIFATRSIQYNLKYPRVGEQEKQEKLIESIYTSFPVQLKFSSDRIGNFRVYILGGGKYDYDLASNSQRRQA